MLFIAYLVLYSIFSYLPTGTELQGHTDDCLLIVQYFYQGVLSGSKILCS